MDTTANNNNKNNKNKNKNKHKNKNKNKNEENEGKKEFNKDEETQDQQLNQLNNLFDKILNIFNNMSDTPPSCFLYLDKLKQKINGHLDEYFDETGIDQAIHQLRTFINSMKLDEKQTKELEEIIILVETAAHKLFDDMAAIQLDIKNIKKDKKEVQKQLDDFKEGNNHLQNQLNDLKNEIGKLKKSSSNKVLKDTYAYLLQLWIDEIDEEFQRKNEETKNSARPTSYNLRNNYSKKALRDIKSGKRIDDEATELINNMVDKFRNEAKLSKNEVIELLLNKKERNRTAHGCIEGFIRDLINDEYTTNDFIKYIEHENEINLCISNKEKEILIKLLQYNIMHYPMSVEKKSYCLEIANI
ncbi:unnamed protein product [Rotaria sp. Silwood1]|nr:unnamed protein product [Rotaria sp. Silwood1]